MAEPKYAEIGARLRERCGGLAVGSRLPSERALAGEFGVSAMTVRQALALLVEEGWITRRPGSGTFVSRPTVRMGPSLTSFSEDMRRLGLRPGARVLRFEPVVRDLETVTHLALRPGQEAILLERLRTADDEPMCHEVSVFPSRLGEALTDHDLSGSVHELLAAAGTAPYAVFRRVRATVIPPREAQLLGVPERSPTLEIVDTFSDAFHRPIQHVRSRYRFDRYEVLSTIERISAPGEGTVGVEG